MAPGCTFTFKNKSVTVAVKAGNINWVNYFVLSGDKFQVLNSCTRAMLRTEDLEDQGQQLANVFKLKLLENQEEREVIYMLKTSSMWVSEGEVFHWTWDVLKGNEKNEMTVWNNGPLSTSRWILDGFVCESKLTNHNIFW